MAKGFKIGVGENNDFDDLFEAPFGNFATNTFTGLNPTCTYIQRYNNTLPANPNYYDGAYRYFYGSDYFSAAPRGSIASNTLLTTITTTSSWITIKSDDGGVKIGNSIYYNSSRGQYPIKRVGLLFCAGGGGGGAGGGNHSGGTGRYRHSTVSGGGGGGGGAAALCTLWLDSYSYRIYIGAGGLRGTQGGGAAGSTSYLQLSNGTGLVTLSGGGGGGFRQTAVSDDKCPGGSGGSVSVSYNGTYFTYISGANGGAGGGGGGGMSMMGSFIWSWNGGSGGNSSISGYISSISNSSAQVSKSGSGGSRQGNAGGGGGASAVGTASGNYGTGGYGSDIGDTTTNGNYYAGNGYNGAQGVAYIYY